MNRRLFLMQAAATAAALSAKGKKIPVGLELYSVRAELMKDDVGTLKAVAKMGYEGVEFILPIRIGMWLRRRTFGSCWTIWG